MKERRNLKDVKKYSIVKFNFRNDEPACTFYLVDKKRVKVYEYEQNCNPDDITLKMYKLYMKKLECESKRKIGAELFKLALSVDAPMYHLEVLHESDDAKEITGHIHKLRLEQAKRVVYKLERFGVPKWADDNFYEDKMNFMSM